MALFELNQSEAVSSAADCTVVCEAVPTAPEEQRGHPNFMTSTGP